MLAVKKKVRGTKCFISLLEVIQDPVYKAVQINLGDLCNLERFLNSAAYGRGAQIPGSSRKGD